MGLVRPASGSEDGSAPATTRSSRSDWPASSKTSIRRKLAAFPREFPNILINWQHDSAILWGVPHAAPAPVALPDPVWAKLWAEADQALYSSARVLPSDWTTRAEAALSGKTGEIVFTISAVSCRKIFCLLWRPSRSICFLAPDRSRSRHRKPRQHFCAGTRPIAKAIL